MDTLKQKYDDFDDTPITGHTNQESWQSMVQPAKKNSIKTTTIHHDACRVLSCGGVSNMWLVPSITFYCHYNIWCCLCSTGPFQFRLLSSWNRKYQPYPLLSYFFVVVWLRCLLHHILSLIAYAFRENREIVFIIIVQLMMSSNSRIRFGSQILFSLYITPSHYHHCASLSEDTELIKCLPEVFCRVCE